MDDAQARIRSLAVHLPRNPGGWAWLVFGAAAIIALATSAVWPTKFSLIHTLVGFGLLGLVLAVAFSFNTVRDEHEESMPAWLVRLLFSFSLVAVVLFCIIYLTSQNLTQLTAAFAGAAAAFALGALAGFIFGVPRAVVSTAGTATTDRTYTPNTNLERISEWLTGMIVGLTLVQFDELRTAFVLASKELQGALGQEQTFVASALLMFFATAGFLIAYLWTRLRLLSDLTRADDVVRREPEYFEGLMHAHLYSTPPAGFRRAIACGLDYRRFFRIPNARVLIYLACAYGQQHRYLKQYKDRGVEREIGLTLDEAKKLCFEVTKEALELDESQYRLLRSLWDPHDEQLADDDLESLYEDPDFKRLFDDYDPKKKAAARAAEQQRAAEAAKIAKADAKKAADPTQSPS